MTSFTKDVAEDLCDVWLSMRFELRKLYRRKRLTMALALAVLLPMLFYVVPPLFDIEYAETATSFAVTNLGFMSLLITISAILFVGDTIAGEFEKRTGLILFPTPQRSNSIFTGKYLAGVLALFSVISVYYLVTVLEMAQVYGMAEVTTEMGKSYLLALIYGAAVISFIMFLSSVMRSGILSSLLGFFSLMMILPITEAVLMMAEIEPWFILTYPYDLVTDVLGLSSGFGGPGGGGGTTFEPDFYSGALVMAAYAVILFIATLFIANRRKME